VHLKKVAMIRGDGTGPELTEAAVSVIKASGAKIELLMCDAGAEWWEKHGGSGFFPDETWKAIDESDSCLKAPTTTLLTPGTPRSVAVSIRQKYNLYANVRPVKTFPNHVGPLGEIDFVCVREATEGLYSGIEYALTDQVAIAIRLITRDRSRRVCNFAFQEARKRRWKRVITISKANILKVTDGLFLKSAAEVAKEFPGIVLDGYFVDNFSQQLVKNPERFNESIIVGTNLFMDILSEEASGLIGSIGLVYSGNFGDDFAMFEPAHGSSPRYRGKNKVNPTAMILSAAWLLQYVGEKRAGDAIFDATTEVIADGKHLTYDLGGTAGTREMGRAIVKLL
jgi:isocitrate dehydrogenase